MRTLITMLLMIIPATALPCTGPEHRQFDFWVGSWRVELPNGKPAGTKVIEGKFENGSMRMGNAGNRITWTPSRDGNVRQLWEQSTDSGKTWKVVFNGKYIPVK